jgi:hypothetical protein
MANNVIHLIRERGMYLVLVMGTSIYMGVKFDLLARCARIVSKPIISIQPKLLV